jgi:hypothetical protein
LNQSCGFLQAGRPDELVKKSPYTYVQRFSLFCQN